MINWPHLETMFEELSSNWNNCEGTRFLVIEKLLEDGMCEKLRADFYILDPKLKGEMVKKHKHVRGKAGANTKKLTDLHKLFFEEINSEKWLDFLSKVTGIDPLLADAELNGGGPHAIRTGGFLNVHTDFNFHPTTSKHRRLNLLLYLNPEWKDEWNGHIEIWKSDLSMPTLKLQPIINRALIFETSEDSYHGHPWPLKTPPEIVRCSMAVYYYSEWPDGIEKRARTNYQLVPGQWADLCGRIISRIEQGITSEADIVSALALDNQTNDIRIACQAISRIGETSQASLKLFPGIFNEIVNCLYAGKNDENSVIQMIGNKYSAELVSQAYQTLRGLRSAVTNVEAYKEDTAGNRVLAK